MLLTAPEWLDVNKDEALATMRAVGTHVRLRVTREAARRWEWFAEHSNLEAKFGWSRSRSAAMHKARLAAHALAFSLCASTSMAYRPLSADSGVLSFMQQART